MKIAGLWSGHDCSFCILADGKPLIHAEYERYLREKEPKGDSVQFMIDRCEKEFNEIDEFATCHPTFLLTNYKESFDKLEKTGKKIHVVSHHQAHAAHAFYSSNFDKAIILTIDGGGVEDSSGNETATTIWEGSSNKIVQIASIHPSKLNIGGLWTRATRYIFKLQNGWPYGHQAGTVMAMAALGNGIKYYEDFYKMMTTDVIKASAKPKDQPIGAYIQGKDPVHPYLDKWAKIAEESEQNKFDLAAALQLATESIVFELVDKAMTNRNIKNLCIAGGVALNSVAMGKITRNFESRVNNVYIPPVPYDGGLTLGAAQYVYFHVLNNDRIKYEDNITPYLGEIYDVKSAVENFDKSKINLGIASIDDIVNLIDEGNIISVFNEGSESGRRALGNRSILADPRDSEMKNKINEKVKHRQWFRPFAPSILRECVKDWFDEDVDSPYMTHVVKFKDEVRQKIPAVVHFDGSARLQTVCKNDNHWYYTFLSKWYNKSGVPIILNTSFNDREPICETPRHALDCFMNTDIDYLYFPEIETLISKRKI